MYTTLATATWVSQPGDLGSCITTATATVTATASSAAIAAAATAAGTAATPVEAITVTVATATTGNFENVSVFIRSFQNCVVAGSQEKEHNKCSCVDWMIGEQFYIPTFEIFPYFLVVSDEKIHSTCRVGIGVFLT